MTSRDQRPRVRLGAATWVLSPEGKLLVVQQEFDGRHTWGCLGGGLEPGETIEECAVREAYEESGLHVRLGRLLYIDQFWRDGEFEHVGFVFLATPDPWPQDVVLPKRDGDALFLAHRWIARDEVESIRQPSANGTTASMTPGRPTSRTSRCDASTSRRTSATYPLAIRPRRGSPDGCLKQRSSWKVTRRTPHASA